MFFILESNVKFYKNGILVIVFRGKEEEKVSYFYCDRWVFIIIRSVGGICVC